VRTNFLQLFNSKSDDSHLTQGSKHPGSNQHHFLLATFWSIAIVMSESLPAAAAPQWTIRILTPIVPLRVGEVAPVGVKEAVPPQALLPTPSPPSATHEFLSSSSAYAWLTQFSSTAKTRRSADESAAAPAPLSWLPPLHLRGQQEQTEHAAYEAMVKACVFPPVAPKHLHASATSATGVPAEPLDALYVNWLQKVGLSPWICAHEQTCGHAYHVPVCSEKEQALSQRHLSRPDRRQAVAATLVSLAALSPPSAHPTLSRLTSSDSSSSSSSTARPLLGGCTVCWKLRCLADELRRAIDADWRFVQSKASVQRLPPPLRMYRLQRLYVWLYREPHWSVWKTAGSFSSPNPVAESSAIRHELVRLDARALSQAELLAASAAVQDVLNYAGSREQSAVAAWCEALGATYPIVYALDWMVEDSLVYNKEQVEMLAFADLYFRVAPPVAVQRRAL
jgi:hypothetical protein